MKEQWLLKVKNLTVSFNNNRRPMKVVDHVSFTLFPGEILGIVGESGSGKSVTVLSLLGLISSKTALVQAESILFSDPDKGEIRMDTRSEKEMHEIRGKLISMIFQEPMTSLNPVFTCGNQVVETIRQHDSLSYREAKEKTLELFNEVSLPDPLHVFRSYPHELSGGQRQRVMIAIAISCNPRILVADEPTTALDVSLQKTILELIKRLQSRRKMSILFITHDLGLIPGFAERVMVMYKGMIVEQGNVDLIFNKPEHPYTKGLLACRPSLDHRPRRLPTIESYQESPELFNHTNTPEIPGAEPILSRITKEERNTRQKVLYQREPMLKIEQLSKQFVSDRGWLKPKRNVILALDQVGFEIFTGETLGIVGESGCGKTTLSRVVLQLIPATAGKIFYKNLDISILTPKKMKQLRKDLQIIFQDPYASLNPRMTIGEALMEPMKVHGLIKPGSKRKERAEELLEKVGLKPDQFYRYPHEFSGGQRQRICIARALAVEPRLIICDESVSALDVSVQAQIVNLLNDLKEEMNLTYIFISHDLSVVKYMSDRIIVMKSGKIVEMGDPDTIFAEPRSDYTKTLIQAVPRLQTSYRVAHGNH